VVEFGTGVNLSELLEAIQSKGTSVSMRDVEKAFKSADKDGDLELEFDEFIIMCDNLLRRGKRLFEQKRVSDVLVDIARSHVLLEAFYVAIERTWKHTASHEPRTYAELQRRAARDSNLQPDFKVRVCEWFDTSTPAALRDLDESNRFVQTSAESTSM
jgi:hypothetical protein